MAIRGVARGLKKAASKAKPKPKPKTASRTPKKFIPMDTLGKYGLSGRAHPAEREAKLLMQQIKDPNSRIDAEFVLRHQLKEIEEVADRAMKAEAKLRAVRSKRKAKPKPKPKTTAKPKTAMKGGPRPAPKKKPMATKPPPVALGLAKGGPGSKAREAKVTELYKVQATIREKAKKAGMSVKRFRQLHPNDPSVKRVYKLRPTIKYEDDVRIYKQSKKK